MRVIWIVGVLLILGTSPAFALDLYWKANTEEDMKEYHVYMCKTKGCTATSAGTLWVGSVPHVTGKAEFTYPIPSNIEGAAVVTAADLAGNNSVPSNMVSFSTVPNLPPAAPVGLGLR